MKDLYLKETCSDGGKLEVFENLMGMMNITKEKVQQFMMASPGEKEEIIENIVVDIV